MQTNEFINKTTLFFVFLLNLAFIINTNAQEVEYAQYEKTTSIQNREIHQIVAEYEGKYYYCVDSSSLVKNHYFDAAEIDKEDDNLLQLPTNIINGFQFNLYNDEYRIQSRKTSNFCGINTGYKLTYSSTLSNNKNLWTFSFQPDGHAYISCKYNASKTYTIVFNTLKKQFVVTTNVNYEDYILPYIFKKQAKFVTNVTISNTLWTTFYSDYNIHIPNGIEIHTIENIDEIGHIKYYTRTASESNTLNLRKNTPILLHSTQPGTYAIYETTDLEPFTISSNNYLRGTSTNQMIEAEDGYSYYMLTYGTLNNKKVFGFFYGAEDGGPFVNKGGKAYLRVPTTIANQAIGFSLTTEDDDITSIEDQSFNKNRNQSITTLSGIRLKHTDKSKLPSGIYIIDGKKVIVK